MRSLLPYRCVDCGADLGVAWACSACGGVARDLAGRPPTAGAIRVARRGRPWRWALGVVPLAIAAGALALRDEAVVTGGLWALALGGGAVAGVLFALALELPGLELWRAGRRELADARRRRDAAGVLRAIADARVGDAVRVRGRVRSLRAVNEPGGRPVAAFRARRIEGVTMLESAACGRFVVDDGTGLALVDEDAFRLEPLDVGSLSSRTPSALLVVDGDLVELVGPARVEAPPSDVGAAPDRGDVTILVYDGRPEAPLLILPLPAGATLASPRLFGGISTPHEGIATRDHQAIGQIEAGGRAEAEERGRFTGGLGG